jgi:hypothetical protein
MTEVLVDDLNEGRRKRARYTVVVEHIRSVKRKRIEEVYEANRAAMEATISENINVELARLKKRRTVTTTAQHLQHLQQREKTMYDEETVKSMIGVALEAQKEQLIESFIDEHLDLLERQRDVVESLQRLPECADVAYIS